MASSTDSSHGSRGARCLRVARRTLLVLALVILVVAVIFSVSPRPGALLMRAAFDADSAKTKRELQRHTRDLRGITSILDVAYRDPVEPESRLDVYLPQTQPKTAPATVVWIHGGGWLSGNRADAAPYFELLAAAGHTVVSIGYSLAPEHQYPTPLLQVNDALAYLNAHATELRINTGAIVLAGDSAGAQLAAQTAALTTNPAYAQQLQIAPALRAGQLAGMVLHCGLYDAGPFIDGQDGPGGIIGFAATTLLWAYTGSRDKQSPVLRQLSVIDHVTADFPRVFITGGNRDPFTNGQSRPFAARLGELGVAVQTRFFADELRPKLLHEYQFHLDLPEARDTLARTLTFLREQ